MFFEYFNKIAKLLTKHCADIKKGNVVLIWGSVETIPLINEIYREVLKNTDGHPIIKIDVPGQEYIYYKEAKDHQLDYKNPFDLFLVSNIDVAIRLKTSANTNELSNISSKKIQRAELAQIDVWQTFSRREGAGELNWIVFPYPSQGMAQQANMSKEEFEDLIITTCFLDKPDPIAIWKELEQKEEKYVDYLNNVDKLHIIGKGTDLTLSVKGRKWISHYGKRNLPDGEVFTGPIEDSLNGIISFTFPSKFRSKPIEDIMLKFKDGKVVESTATKGQEILKEILKIPGAKRVGEFAIGTNYEISKFVGEILFDEKIGGTIHMALGNGYPETGSKNRSVIHWDLVCDMRKEGQILADGKEIYRDGKFVI